MILNTDQQIKETITDVELSRELIEELGWYTESERLGFKNELTFFNENYHLCHINYVLDIGQFIFVYVSKDICKLTSVHIHTYKELMKMLHDYRQ